MGLNGVNKVWIGVSGVSGYEVKCASTLKGLSELIGASYSTMKSKGAKAEMFNVVVEDLKVWFCVRIYVSKVSGRGGSAGKFRKSFEIIR